VSRLYFGPLFGGESQNRKKQEGQNTTTHSPKIVL
jgi:hypothetical protein